MAIVRATVAMRRRWLQKLLMVGLTSHFPLDNYVDGCTYTRQIRINARISNTNEPRSECPTFLKVAPKPCDQKVFD